MKKDKDKTVVMSMRFSVEQRDWLDAQCHLLEDQHPGLRIGPAEAVRMLLVRFIASGEKL